MVIRVLTDQQVTERWHTDFEAHGDHGKVYVVESVELKT